MTRAEDRVVRLRDLIDPIRAELSAFLDSLPIPRQKRVVKHIPGAGILAKWVDSTPISDQQRRRIPVDVWPAAFPMVIEEPRTGVLIYVIDSNAIGGNIVSNAFGKLRWDSAILLRRLQRHFGRRPSIFLLHHHIALPPNRLKFVRARPRDALMRRFMVLSNPSDLIAALPHDRETVIFHGHRHVAYLGQLGNLQVVSAPSSTLGDESEQPVRNGPGYSVFSVVVTATAGTLLAHEEWIRC
jgi:hypothetical protein